MSFIGEKLAGTSSLAIYTGLFNHAISFHEDGNNSFEAARIRSITFQHLKTRAKADFYNAKKS